MKTKFKRYRKRFGRNSIKWILANKNGRKIKDLTFEEMKKEVETKLIRL